MYPGYWAAQQPDHIAAVLTSSQEAITYAELDARSNQFSQYLFERGLRRNDHIAVFMENNLRFFEVVWAALRSGLYVTTINRYLTADEVAYIVEDSGSRALISTASLSEVCEGVATQVSNCPIRLMVESAAAGWSNYEEAIADAPSEPLPEQWIGGSMLYSSGTTGRPKGIIRPLPELRLSDLPTPSDGATGPYGFNRHTVYLSPAPLYHSAPFAFTTNIQRQGGTVVVMPRFDAVDALRCIQDFEITHSQWVPTMFVRMLKLAEGERTGFDLSSHQVAIHAAAPCPVDVKRRMIEWWGPIIEEYYAGTEGNGSTRIGSLEWLEHPGSVGKTASGVIHICDEDGTELPTGEAGIVYFEQERMTYAYHNAPEKTREARHPQHPNWSALGDVGYLDEAGYLYLTDRKSFMIVSGGVNIYPQEIENAVILHDYVLDVAVFGVPNEDFGEEVKAVVQLADGIEESDAVRDEILDFARDRLANYMVPRSIDFIDELPRLPTGKLYKRLLRDRYWGKHDTRII
ncbi:MAG: acyl-CoA synthetase [Gammaproteobacteria bacterium]|nr:acyl-CoA synthetase [Gammaproteobacteria bacterium]